MDFSSAFKSEVFRPIATLLVPGAVALAPYALLAIHYNPAIESFGKLYPGILVALLVAGALGVGMILEDLGSRIESEVWDPIIDKETGCHHDDWNLFLSLAPTEERIGHRYLRTVTLRMKFELSFGIALLAMWFGLLWLDAVQTLWTEDSVIVLSGGVLTIASYLLWESFGSAWILGRLRHIIALDTPCAMQLRIQDEEPGRTRFDWFLLGVACLCGVWSVVLITTAFTSTREVGRNSGLTSGLLLSLFAFVSVRTIHWVRTNRYAVGRRRGVALRLSLAFALFSGFLGLRVRYASPPFSMVTLIGCLVLAVLFYLFARHFWRESAANPNLREEAASIPS